MVRVTGTDSGGLDTRAGNGERGKKSEGDRSRGGTKRARERETAEAAPRGGTRWGLSGRKPSAVNI